MNKIKLAWLVGIFEGEGSFSLSRSRKRYAFFNLNIRITNTDLMLLRECKEIAEKEIGIKTSINGRNKIIENRKPRYDLLIYSLESGFKFLSAILPYLIGEKKAQAQLLIQFLNRRLAIKKAGLRARNAAYTEEDKAYYTAIKALRKITEPVETERSLSHEDKVTVRTANINKIADLSRNDLSIHLN
jgi:hypothetical protein